MAECGIACVASVSVLFRSKERPRNEILGFGRARNETPFFAWPLLRNSTETLASKAKCGTVDQLLQGILSLLSRGDFSTSTSLCLQHEPYSAIFISVRGIFIIIFYIPNVAMMADIRDGDD